MHTDCDRQHVQSVSDYLDVVLHLDPDLVIFDHLDIQHSTSG